MGMRMPLDSILTYKTTIKPVRPLLGIFEKRSVFDIPSLTLINESSGKLEQCL